MIPRRGAQVPARFVLSLAVLETASLVTGPAALAGSCTDPQSETQFVCTGDLSTGLDLNNTGASAASSVTVEDLTANLAPSAAGVAGVSWSGGNQQNLYVLPSGQFGIVQAPVTLKPALSFEPMTGAYGGDGSSGSRQLGQSILPAPRPGSAAREHRGSREDPQ